MLAKSVSQLVVVAWLLMRTSEGQPGKYDEIRVGHRYGALEDSHPSRWKA
jgi:hypothetical protein